MPAFSNCALAVTLSDLCYGRLVAMVRQRYACVSVTMFPAGADWELRRMLLGLLIVDFSE